MHPRSLCSRVVCRKHRLMQASFHSCVRAGRSAVATAGLLLAVWAAGCAGAKHTGAGWRQAFHQALPRLGHRNWILIVDSAYPAQTAPGVRMLWTGAPMEAVLPEVLEAVKLAPHVRAQLFLDAELAQVDEADAPGAEACRQWLQRQLAGWPVQARPHGELLEEIDQQGRQYEVWVLKTSETIPYSSVFLKLECGYWDDTAEQRLRQRLAGTAEPPVVAQGLSEDEPTK